MRTTEPVALERIQLAMKAPASDTLTRHPQTKIARIDASRKVVVIAHVVDTDSKAMVNRQRLLADETLSYDCKTGDYRVSGKGQFQLNGPIPRASNPADANLPIEQAEISFRTGMMRIWSLENEAGLARHFLEFTGDVTIAQPATDGTHNTAKSDGDKKAHGYITADGLRLIVERIPRSEQSSKRYRVRATAEGNVKVVSGDKTIDVPYLRYDSAEQ